MARSFLRLELARPTSNPRLRVDALLWLAFLDRQTGHAPTTAVRRAALAAAALPHGALRDDALDEVRFASAIHSGDGASGEALFSEVIEYRKKQQQEIGLLRAYVERARLYRRRARYDLALADLEKAMRIVESGAADVGDIRVRDTYYDVSYDVHEEMTGVLIDQGDLDMAFVVADRGRARVLTDRGERDDFRLSELQRNIPAGTLMVHYTTTTDRTLIVTADSRTIVKQMAEIGQKQITSLRKTLTEAIAKNDTSVIVSTASHLHRLLLGPVDYTNYTTLVFIPDEATSGIPFAALRDANSGWLIERAVILVAPAAGLLGTESQINLDRVSILADSAFNAAVLPSQKRLPAARHEARLLTKIFPDANAKFGTDATRVHLEEAITDSDLLHVATHAISDDRDASRSALVVAGDDHEESLFYTRDILSVRARPGQFVVLAGCRTGVAGGGRGSLRSLAMAFIAAGSSMVLATLWDAEDQAASRLTLDFYRALKTGVARASNDLRTAQLAAIRQGRPPRDWAGFQLIMANTRNFERTDL